MSEIGKIFNVMSSTTKVKYSLLSQPDEYINLIFIVCVSQRNLLPFCGELLAELVIYSIIYSKKIETVENRYMLKIRACGD